MSSVVRTITPFINRELLLEALNTVGCNYTIQGNDIITDRRDYYGLQEFVFENGRYVFKHDSSAEDMRHGPNYPWGNIDMKTYKTVSSFISAVSSEYNAIYKRQLEELERKRLAAIAEQERLKKQQQLMDEKERLRQIAKAEEDRKKAEEEKLRMENERKEFVEKQKAAIVAKAKEKGFDVRETVVDNKVKLVLVQTTY